MIVPEHPDRTGRGDAGYRMAEWDWLDYSVLVFLVVLTFVSAYPDKVLPQVGFIIRPFG